MLKLTTPRLATILLLGCITLLNALVANRVGLSVDEAHYALYANHLAWSYFDHPPLVGWLQALILPFSHSDFALRIWPMLFNLGSAAVLYRLSARFFAHESAWFGFWCVALMQSAIIIDLLALAWLPQTPFIFFGLLSLFYLYQSVQQERLIDFLLLGLCLGLAALSEYTAGFLALGSAFYIITTKPRLLYHYKLYLAALIVVLCILPILLWNYQHDWISFAYQQNHVLNAEHWSGKMFSFSQLVQLFAYTPTLYMFGLAAIMQLRYWRIDSVRLLILFIIPTLLFFAYGSGYTFTLPHWTALCWLAAIPLGVHYIIHHWHKKWTRIIIWCSAIYSVVLILLVHVLAWQCWFNLPLAQQPLRDVYGWNTAAQVALQELKKLPSDPATPAPNLYVTNWTLASRLAWYSQHPVQIIGSEGNKQFTLWYGRPQNHSRAIVVMPYGTTATLVGIQSGQFASCKLLSHLPIYNHQILVNSFDFYDCVNYHS